MPILGLFLYLWCLIYICAFMENINEGYLLGNNHLDFDDDEREVLLIALTNHLQFCSCYEDLDDHESLCRQLLRKLGCKNVVVSGLLLRQAQDYCKGASLSDLNILQLSL